MNVIYKISFQNKPYKLIGSTNNFSRRKANHLSNLKRNKHPNIYLQRIYNKYPNTISIDIIHKNIPSEILLNVEDIYIGINCGRIEDSGNGLNIRDASRPRHSNETINKISNNRKGKLLGRDNPFYGKTHNQDFKNSQREKALGRRIKNTCKRILQYDINGNFIKEWDTITDAAKFVKSTLKLLQNRIKYSDGYHHGFIWKYFEDNYSLIIKSHDNSKIRRSKPVFQFDMNGKFIKEWIDPKTAAKSLGFSYASEISKAALGKIKSSHGFIWKYNLCQDQR